MRANLLTISLSHVIYLLSSLPQYGYASPNPPETRNEPKFDWASLKASPNLTWHDCYSSTTQASAQHILKPPPSRSLQCARLSVPLDYHNTTSTQTVSLALLKVSAAPSASHRGTITFVPGGAGESRIKITLWMESSGELDLLDPEFAYDFVTFDNRGTGYSLPKAECFGSIVESKVWDRRLNDLSGVMSTENGINARVAGAYAIGQLCAEAGDEGRDVRRHISTAYIARDVLEILYKREEEREPIEARRQEPKAQFMGMSYGTMVGQTFASMYPKHVSRMLLDGSVDAYDWTSKWPMAFLDDIDALWSTFFTDCFEAKEACPLWRAEDKEALTIKRRVENAVETSKHRPFYTISNGKPTFITYRDVKLAFVIGTYRAHYAFKPLAEILNGLMSGYTNVTLTVPFDDGDLSFPTDEDDADLWADVNTGAGVAINCADGDEISDTDISELQEYILALDAQSSLGGIWQAERRVRCLGWPKSEKTAWRYAGPFEANLTVPILYIGTALDPATPLSNSFKMAKGFPGSVVVEQRSRAHCVLLNAGSDDCTIRLIRDYLNNGTLPKMGTVCGTDCNAFDGSCEKAAEGTLVSSFRNGFGF